MPTTSDTLRRVLAWTLRVLLAVLFLLSAVAKLFSIDDFELYIFSFGFLSLNGSFLLARLCIGIELLLASMLVLGWWRRWVNLAVLALLLLFSIFLCYAALAGRSDSCHCMGRLADMPPAASLLKNALLIVMLLLHHRWPTPQLFVRMNARLRSVLTVVLAVALLAVPFIVSVPDNWMFGPEETRYDRELLQQTVTERGLDDGRQLVALVTPGCPYCRMTRQKLGSIATRNHLDSTRIHYIGPDELGTTLFLQITFGQRPLVVLIDDGVPATTYHYRNISEKQVSQWLKGDD